LDLEEGADGESSGARLAACVLRSCSEGESEHDAENGHRLGNERVLELVKQHRDKSAHEIVQALYKAAREFAGNSPQIDDLTAIVIKVN
jgi:serine phosphatase RsbU (regulator of sigma subunit)